MHCKTYDLNTLGNYRFVVVLSKYQGKILLSRHKARETWETQGGHIERGETPLEAAKRELFEESGATEFAIAPAFDYWAADEGYSIEDTSTWSNGMVFTASITELSALPASFEMKETALFDALPDALTYPDITPALMRRAGRGVEKSHDGRVFCRDCKGVSQRNGRERRAAKAASPVHRHGADRGHCGPI